MSVSEPNALSLDLAQDFRWLGKRERALGIAAPAHLSPVCQPHPHGQAFPVNLPSQTQVRVFREPMAVPQAENLMGTVFKGLPLASGAS